VKIRLREEAEGDLLDAAKWYERQRPRLGQEFIDAAQASFKSIAERPLTFPIVHRQTRRAVMERFPFCIYFREIDPDVVVLAVLHGSRHPQRWQRHER